MGRTSNTSARFTDGSGVTKRVTPRPKDWAFKKPSEGREGKGKRTRVRMKERGWSLADLNAHLAEHRAGLPDCAWTITCNNPQRRLTATDYLYIRCAAYKHPLDVVVVQYNEDSKIMTIDDISEHVPTAKAEPGLGEGTLG